MSSAERFVELLEAGKMKKRILPNTEPDYTKYQEKRDLEEYRFFMNSFALDELIECEVASYSGDEQV